jgi:hypothetical protein
MLPLDCNSKNEYGILATTQGICYDLWRGQCWNKKIKSINNSKAFTYNQAYK